MMYAWALKPFGRLGWLAAFLFVACGALRLARFNVQVNTVESKRFVGLPIPAAASMVAATVLLCSTIIGWPSSFKAPGHHRPDLSAGIPDGLRISAITRSRTRR